MIKEESISCKLTHAIKTLLGKVVFGSLTFKKANCILPSENSSMRSISSPSTIFVSLHVIGN